MPEKGKKQVQGLAKVRGPGRRGRAGQRRAGNFGGGRRGQQLGSMGQREREREAQ